MFQLSIGSVAALYPHILLRNDCGGLSDLGFLRDSLFLLLFIRQRYHAAPSLERWDMYWKVARLNFNVIPVRYSPVEQDSRSSAFGILCHTQTFTYIRSIFPLQYSYISSAPSRVPLPPTSFLFTSQWFLPSSLSPLSCLLSALPKRDTYILLGTPVPLSGSCNSSG